MGDFLPESSIIIQQHVAQSNIAPDDEFLCQWVEYINAHVLSPIINYKVFSDVLDNLVKPINSGRLCNEEVGFLDKYLVNFFNYVLCKLKRAYLSFVCIS